MTRIWPGIDGPGNSLLDELRPWGVYRDLDDRPDAEYDAIVADLEKSSVAE